MKFTNRKLLLATAGSAGVLTMLITVTLMGVSRSVNEVPTATGQPRAITPAPRAAVGLTPPARLEEPGAAQAMAREQAELREKIERLESLLAGAANGQHARHVDHADAGLNEEALPESPEAQEERAMGEVRSQIATLETTLDAEFVDRDWSDTSFASLREAFEGETAEGIELLEADCRSSMCRLTLAFDPEQVEESFKKLGGVVPWEGEMFFQVDDLTSGEAVVYVAREDHPLPRAASE